MIYLSPLASIPHHRSPALLFPTALAGDGVHAPVSFIRLGETAVLHGAAPPSAAAVLCPECRSEIPWAAVPRLHGLVAPSEQAWRAAQVRREQPYNCAPEPQPDDPFRDRGHPEVYLAIIRYVRI
jgi:hypothetical protein